MKIFKKIFLANFRETMRDRAALFWFLAFPLIFSVFFGIIFSGNTKQSNQIGLILPEQQNSMIQQFIDRVSAVPAFNVTSGSEEELAALEKGQRSVVLSLVDLEPARVSSQGGLKVPLYYDSSKMMVHQSILPVIEGILIDMEFGLIGHERNITLQPQAIQARQMTDFEYILPGLLALALMQLGLLGSLRFLELRENKILKGLSITPLPRGILLISELLIRLIISLVQALLIILVGKIVFGVTIVGNLFAVIGIVILGALVFISLGYLLISFAKSIDSGNGIIQAVQIPFMFLAGIFFPVEILPGYIQPLVKVIPLTYLGDLLRQVMMGVTAQHSLMVNFLVLGGWLILSVTLTMKFWKWE